MFVVVVCLCLSVGAVRRRLLLLLFDVGLCVDVVVV